MKVTPYTNTEQGKKEQVERMFNEIAFRYDLLNELLSFGIHKHWRRQAIRMLKSRQPKGNGGHILDVATGTGEFAIDAIALAPPVIGKVLL